MAAQDPGSRAIAFWRWWCGDDDDNGGGGGGGGGVSEYYC
jgi:hypothetical protein